MNRFHGLAYEETEVTRALRDGRLPEVEYSLPVEERMRWPWRCSAYRAEEKEEQKKSREMLRRVTGLAYNPDKKRRPSWIFPP